MDAEDSNRINDECQIFTGNHLSKLVWTTEGTANVMKISKSEEFHFGEL